MGDARHVCRLGWRTWAMLGLGMVLGPVLATALTFQAMGRHETWVPEMVGLLRAQVVAPLVNRQDTTDRAASALQGQVAEIALRQTEFRELLLRREQPRRHAEHAAIHQLIVDRCPLPAHGTVSPGGGW